MTHDKENGSFAEQKFPEGVAGPLWLQMVQWPVTASCQNTFCWNCTEEMNAVELLICKTKRTDTVHVELNNILHVGSATVIMDTNEYPISTGE